MATRPRPSFEALPDFGAFGDMSEELKEYLLQQHIQLVELQKRVETLENAP